MNMHPSESELSLFAGGEVGVLERWRISRHVRRCASCESSVRAFQNAISVVASGVDEFPAGLDWDSLAREMTGNIRVGLAAGECVGEVRPKRDLRGLRAAAVVCSATMLLVVAWMINIPTKPVQEATVALQKIEGGIQLRQGGGAITLLNSRAASPVISSSSPGQLRARYVDEETDQVTINNVYAQ